MRKGQYGIFIPRNLYQEGSIISCGRTRFAFRIKDLNIGNCLQSLEINNFTGNNQLLRISFKQQKH